MSRMWLAAGLFLFVVGCGEGGGVGGGSGSSNNPTVEMVTDMGTIRIELFEERAPITVKNFLQYVDAKHYDGTIFHRVMSGFMIQGGGFTPAMNEKPTGPAIRNESNNGLTNEIGTLAMARTNFPDSATSQFFINVVKNDSLNRSQARDGVGYAVFGKVISGMEVVEKIRFVPTVDRGGHESVPINPVMIQSIRRLAVEKK